MQSNIIQCTVNWWRCHHHTLSLEHINASSVLRLLNFVTTWFMIQSVQAASLVIFLSYGHMPNWPFLFLSNLFYNQCHLHRLMLFYISTLIQIIDTNFVYFHHSEDHLNISMIKWWLPSINDDLLHSPIPTIATNAIDINRFLLPLFNLECMLKRIKLFSNAFLPVFVTL